MNPDVPNDTVRTWLIESRNEERLLTRAAKMAIDAGVADALVRRIELEGQLAVDALVAGLDVLDLPGEQRMLALSAMHDKLAGGTGTFSVRPSIEGVVERRDEEDR